jgi:LmeA-like phospholipid-binding
MRASAIAVAVLVVLLLLADVGARRYEEARVASSIQKSLNLRAKPAVSLHGFPFLSEVVQGKISTGTVSASMIRQSSIRFSDVHLVLQDITFSVSQLLNGNLHAIHAVRGVGRAAVTAAALNSFLGAHGVPFDLGFEKGQTIARLGPLSAPIDVQLTLVDGTLRISAGPLPAVAVPLPPLLRGITYGATRPGRGRLILNFRLDHPTLDLRP